MAKYSTTYRNIYTAQNFILPGAGILSSSMLKVLCNSVALSYPIVEPNKFFYFIIIINNLDFEVIRDFIIVGLCAKLYKINRLR